MSAKQQEFSNLAVLFMLLATASTTAVSTYIFTKKATERREQQRRLERYQKERAVKTQTKDDELQGTLLNGGIDKVFLWEVEDLAQLFPPQKRIPNEMKLSGPPRRDNLHLAASMFRGDSMTEDEQLLEGPATGRYNKLIDKQECILADLLQKSEEGKKPSVAYVRAGPRRFLHFDPQTVNAAIVTCGGLCPGLNNVIREITHTLYQNYGIGGKVYGIRGGYKGFDEQSSGMKPLELTPELVNNIHYSGGTVLGSSRGGFDIQVILKFIRDRKIQQLYVIGGDGTHRGAFAIHESCIEAGLNVAVAGIPKTIDNDVDYIDYSFGFRSAVEAAQVALRSAKTEAVCNLPNGIGIVKLMGRSAGFIAAHATMASGDVDLCLIPEVDIVLEGPNGCLPYLRRRVKEQGYAVVVVAEGAGEELLGQDTTTDASGNKKLPPIGQFMKKQIEDYFVKHGEVATVKYIDPSYTVRSVPANATDSLYCMQLAQNAVHGAMAGFTGFSVGLCNNRMVLLPIPQLVATSPRSMNPHGRTWERVLSLTRQPNTVPPPVPGEKRYNTYAPPMR